MDTCSLNASALHRIAVVVPQLPPALGRLGNYSLHLAHQLRHDFGIESEFIITDPTWPYGPRLDGFDVHSVARSTPKDFRTLLTRLDVSTVLVHYASGEPLFTCPWWMLDALEEWQRVRHGCHIVTMFHDLYSFGPVWSGAFWRSPLQRKRVSHLARLSDRVLTNCQSHTVKLWMLSGGKHTTVPTLPVFSTLGEPSDVLPLADRPRSLMVMGSGRDRQALYARSHDRLSALCALLQIEVICEIGSPLMAPTGQIGTIPIHALGLNPPAITSQLLSTAAVGLLAEDPSQLATSAAFAAYAAHGLIPVSITDGAPRATDRLQPSRHYWTVPQHLSEMNWEAGQAIATRAHRWYQPHCLRVHARTFAQCLLPTQPSKTISHSVSLPRVQGVEWEI